MSYERIIKTLTTLGLTKRDAYVYVHLATNGPQRAENIAKELKLQEVQLHQTMQNLQSRGMVNCAWESTPLFTALPFDKALDLLIKAHLKETHSIEIEKERILTGWQSTIPNHSKN